MAPFASFDVPVLRAAFACNEQTRARTLQGNLQRHIRKIAKDLGADETTACIEYCEVAPLILDLTSRGRPLATASNSEVWAAMLEPNVRLSHLPQRSTFRTLHVLIRFYISIEDGECAVERDLGVLAKFEQAHTNGGNDLSDDLIMAKTDTTTADDICAGGLAVGSCAELGPKGRRWATLWRAVHGARLGCYRISSHGKRGKRPGTYEAAKAGVLAAAEYAVATNGSVAQMNEGEDKIVPLGVRQSFLKAPLGDKADAYTNKAMKRFAALTVAKRLKAQPFINRCTKTKWVEKRAAKLAQRLQNVKQVCYVGDIGDLLPHPVTDKRGGLNEVSGRNRCLFADLVVVDDLSRLHDCPCEATLCQVLAIVARGLPVVTRASWVLARGDSECIPKESVIRHRPLAIETKCVFQYDPHFEARSGNLLKMLVALSKLQESQWQVRRSGGCDGVAHEAAVLDSETQAHTQRTGVKLVGFDASCAMSDTGSATGTVV